MQRREIPAEISKGGKRERTIEKATYGGDMKSNEWPTIAWRLTTYTCVCACLHMCVYAIKELRSHVQCISGTLKRSRWSPTAALLRIHFQTESAQPTPGLNEELSHKELFTA